MRIALCLSGIVGKLYTNKGNYKWGKNRLDKLVLQGGK